MTTTLSLYNASVPALIRMMDNLEHILRKGEANAAERGIDASVFLSARLAPDMLNLVGQVQVGTAIAKACPFRLAGTTPPVYDDKNESFADLYALLDKTRKDIRSVSVAQIDGREAVEFTVKMGPSERIFSGIAYLSGFTIPNVYFHITTVYNILRHNGVPLGKVDFFGAPKE